MIVTTTPLSELSPRQRDVLLWLADYVERYGYAPTIREGAAAFGFRSPNGLMVHIRALRKKGLVVSDGGACRSLRIADGVTMGEHWLQAARDELKPVEPAT